MIKKRITVVVNEVDNGFTVNLQSGGQNRATKIAKDAQEATQIATDLITEAINPPAQKAS